MLKQLGKILVSGVSGIGPLTRVDADDFPAKVAAEVKDFDLTVYLDKKEARKMDRFTHYAVAASIMAVKDANLDINEENSERIGVWIGSGIGGMETFETQYDNFLQKGYRRVSPFFVPMMIPDMAAGQVSIHLVQKELTHVQLQLVQQEQIPLEMHLKLFNVEMPMP